MAESPKFSRLKGNRVRGTRCWRQILDRKWKYGRFAHAQWKICNKTLIYGWLTKFSRLLGNQGRGTRCWRQILDRKLKCGRFAHAQWIICNITLIYGRTAQIFASFRKSGSRNTMVTSDFSPEVEIRPFRARAMHPAIIIGTVRSLWSWTWLWGRYHVPQNAFLVD